MKLERDFLGKSGVFDISKVPDIYDCVKYDLQHNRQVLVSGRAEELYTYAKNMADVVIPQEYVRNHFCAVKLEFPGEDVSMYCSYCMRRWSRHVLAQVAAISNGPPASYECSTQASRSVAGRCTCNHTHKRAQIRCH